MVVKIELSKKGKYAGQYTALVDDEDEILAEFNWMAHGCKYAGRDTKEKKRVFLHQMVLERMLGRPLEKGEFPDHIDGNGFNNQRSNIRRATKSQNMQNRGAQKNNTSGYKGVYFYESKNKYTATIGLNGKTIHLGYFRTAELAHEAYSKKANELHENFANTGIPK
jgi:hypothetical protein